MGREGWNYENLNSSGRNVYFFRDTNHTSGDIQERILTQLSSAINRNLFDTLFIEDSLGVYQTPYDSSYSEEMIRQLEMKEGVLDPVEILAFRLREKIAMGSFRIYGVEEEDIFDQHGTVIRQAAELYVQMLGKPKTPESDLEWDRLVRASNHLAHLRNQIAVDNLVKYMEDSSLENAGIIFGNGHYCEMSELLKQKGIGYASYYPGKIMPTLECALNHALSI